MVVAIKGKCTHTLRSSKCTPGYIPNRGAYTCAPNDIYKNVYRITVFSGSSINKPMSFNGRMNNKLWSIHKIEEYTTERMDESQTYNIKQKTVGQRVWFQKN